jgi:hypothetical protein
MGRVDDAAAAQIALACRQVTPDITDAEVAHFIRQEGPALSRNRGLDNPMGVLIRHIPRCCRGESLRLHRDAERLEHERRQQQAANWLEDARLILTDPNSGQHEREWAQEIIDRYGEGK